MPWGDKTMVTSNVYQHIKSRHKFDYGKSQLFILCLVLFCSFFLDTYVNYEQDEEMMMREALQASLLYQ